MSEAATWLALMMTWRDTEPVRRALPNTPQHARSQPAHGRNARCWAQAVSSVWRWAMFILGGVCLLLPLAGWAFLASRTGDMLAALAAAGQVIAILVWALTWAFLRRDQVPKRPSSRKHHQRG